MNYFDLDLETAFRAVDITTPEMRYAIQKWYSMYYEDVPSEDSDSCQRIPYTIVNKLTKTAFSEYTATSRDAFTQSVLEAVDRKKQTAMHRALIGGESGLKPVPEKDGFSFYVVNRRDMLVFARDEHGDPIDIGTCERSTYDRFYYTLLERRTVRPDGYLTITNKLYRAQNPDTLGLPVPLDSLPQYAPLQEEYTFEKPIGGVGIAWLKTPIENCVDGSLDCVSVYAPAVGLIQNIDRNEAQLSGEFERGKSRIIASADMLEIDETGKKKLSAHVFTGLDESPEDVGITIFSPALREQSYLERKREYLRNVESLIGLKRGLLSEVEAVERTATEVTSSEGDYALTITDVQRMWENALREAVRICGILGQLYHISGAHDVDDEEVIVSFGNGVLYDEEKTGEELLAQVQAGLLQPERYLGWYYDLPCDTDARRKAIRKEYMPDVKENLEE